MPAYLTDIQAGQKATDGHRYRCDSPLSPQIERYQSFKKDSLVKNNILYI